MTPDLLLHGTTILFIGVLSGFPYWLAIIRNVEMERVASWRVAHAFLVANGLVMMVVALILRVAGLSVASESFTAWSLTVSGYGFAWAFVLGAVTGYRALTPTRRLWDLLLFPGHLVGAAGSIAGLGALLLGMLGS